MMAEPVSIQNKVLEQLQKNGTTLTAFLVNGVPLKGKLIGFDDYTLLLEVNGKQQLILKKAVSTVVPLTTHNHS